MKTVSLEASERGAGVTIEEIATFLEYVPPAAIFQLREEYQISVEM
jgi:hypothetical protein